VLRFGIEFNDWIADWFERQALAFEEGIPLTWSEVHEKGKERS
jgi:hypothetical protein